MFSPTGSIFPDSPFVKPKNVIVCCGNPKDLDANSHPYILIGENEYGDDVWRCPKCGAESTD